MNYYESYEASLSNQQEVERLRAEVNKSKRLKKDIDKYNNDIKNEKIKMERVVEEIEKMQQLLPSEISDTENISLLRKMAEDLNIKEVSITPLNEENKEFYISKKYKFKAKATFLQFLIVFEKISDNKRILNVQDVSFRKLEQPQKSKFQLIDGEFALEAYKYNPNHKERESLQKFENEKNQANPAFKKKNKAADGVEA